MVRMTCGALMSVLAAGLLFVSCGDKIPEEITKTWDQRETEVMAQLNEVKTKFDDLMSRFQALPKDSSTAAERTAVESQLRENESQIGEIEKTLNTLKTQKDSLVAAGYVSDFKALWEKAQGTYNDVSARLTGILASLGPIDDKVKNMASAEPAADSATAAAARGADTAASSAPGSSTSGTNGQATTSSPRGTSSSSGTTSSGTTSSRRAGTTSESDKEPLLKANENPAGTPEGSAPVDVKVKPNTNPK